MLNFSSQKGEQKTLQVQQSPLLVCAFVVMTKVGIVLLKDHEHEWWIAPFHVWLLVWSNLNGPWRTNAFKKGQKSPLRHAWTLQSGLTWSRVNCKSRAQWHHHQRHPPEHFHCQSHQPMQEPVGQQRHHHWFPTICSVFWFMTTDSIKDNCWLHIKHIAKNSSIRTLERMSMFLQLQMQSALAPFSATFSCGHFITSWWCTVNKSSSGDCGDSLAACFCFSCCASSSKEVEVSTCRSIIDPIRTCFFITRWVSLSDIGWPW